MGKPCASRRQVDGAMYSNNRIEPPLTAWPESGAIGVVDAGNSRILTIATLPVVVGFVGL